MSGKNTKRYPDADLAIFREHILKKLEENQAYCEELEAEIKETVENAEEELSSNFMENSTIHSDIQMMNNMLGRRRKLVYDLERALFRIEQKTYGICAVTGELIDKKRLMAAPITTKSLAAKLSGEERKVERIDRLKKTPTNKIITKIKKKPVVDNKSMEDEALFDQIFDDLIDGDQEDDDNPAFDFESLADESTLDNE